MYSPDWWMYFSHTVKVAESLDTGRLDDEMAFCCSDRRLTLWGLAAPCSLWTFWIKRAVEQVIRKPSSPNLLRAGSPVLYASDLISQCGMLEGKFLWIRNLDVNMPDFEWVLKAKENASILITVDCKSRRRIVLTQTSLRHVVYRLLGPAWDCISMGRSPTFGAFWAKLLYLRSSCVSKARQLVNIVHTGNRFLYDWRFVPNCQMNRKS